MSKSFTTAGTLQKLLVLMFHFKQDMATDKESTVIK